MSSWEVEGASQRAEAESSHSSLITCVLLIFLASVSSSWMRAIPHRVAAKTQ